MRGNATPLPGTTVRPARGAARPASLDLGFLVKSVLAIPLAVLHELQLFLLGLAVLGRGIVPALALGARKGDDLYGLFLGGHASFLSAELRRGKPLRPGISLTLRAGDDKHPGPYVWIRIATDSEPSNGIEPLTLSLPWICSAN